ncbi:phosphate ABC transporter permease [Halovenus sp. WSH3]|uniref:Phosphate ABC transporter permease n=1 Tax=Halovenus carboxidivorans TaxID=2692199 RepID=A0A6B0SZZ3_9EURY|nr:phosphate ABC transporter permease [Halovenus carboxidivorans]MXR50557.1 phosphate ABC transporter permease [Halovenus carboxidivorans]
MVELLDIAFVVGGAILLFFGAVLSVYGVGLLGAAVGAGAGYLIAPTIGGVVGLEGALASLVAIPVGAIGGVLVTYLLLSLAVAAISFVVGAYFGMIAIAPALGNTGTIAAVGTALGVGLAAAVLGSFLTKTMMVFITSAMGAALVSRQLTISGLRTAQSELTVDPLIFEPMAPVFLGLFALGVLSQFGLFKLGWVTSIVARLPGARQLRNRGDEEVSGS